MAKRSSPNTGVSRGAVTGAGGKRTARTRVGIHQVAAACGLAPSTVSGVLNQRTDCRVSTKTRDRIYETVRRLGYRPSLTAKGLASGRTDTLGLIGTAQDIEPSNRLCYAFEAEARRHGYLTLVILNPNDPDAEDKQVTWLDDRSVDGMFVLPCEDGPHDQLAEQLRRGRPLVTLDAAGRLPFPVADVSADYQHGGRLQAQHLLELGRRRICFANGLHSCWVVDQRIAGAEQVLLEAGCPEPLRMNVPFEIFPIMAGPAETHDYIRDFLSRHAQECDAIIATGDELGIIAMGLAMQLGLKVPQDLAFVGYDGIRFAANPFMPLTTVANPLDDMGRAAFQLLRSQINGEIGRPQDMQVIFKPSLIARNSTLGS